MARETCPLAARVGRRARRRALPGGVLRGGGEAVDPRRPPLRRHAQGAPRPPLRRRAAHPHHRRPRGAGPGRGGGQRRSSPTPTGPDASLVVDRGRPPATCGRWSAAATSSAPSPIAKLNLATQGPRQAGSSFKPLRPRHRPRRRASTRSTRISAPSCITIPMRERGALAARATTAEAAGARSPSPRAPCARTTPSTPSSCMRVGPKAAMEMATRMGIRSPLEPVPSAVLGSNDVTAMDMAAAYSTFANRGIRVPPVLVTRITRADGTVLYNHEHRQTKVLEAGIVDTVTSILEQVIERGTGTRAKLDRPAAGKTGTTDDNKDAWFAGYTAAARHRGVGRVPAARRRRQADPDAPAEHPHRGHRRLVPRRDLAAVHERRPRGSARDAVPGADHHDHGPAASSNRRTRRASARLTGLPDVRGPPGGAGHRDPAGGRLPCAHRPRPRRRSGRPAPSWSRARRPGPRRPRGSTVTLEVAPTSGQPVATDDEAGLGDRPRPLAHACASATAARRWAASW